MTRSKVPEQILRFEFLFIVPWWIFSARVNYPVRCWKCFSDEHSPHKLKLCYFLTQNQIEAEAFRQGKLIFQERRILTDGRKQLLDTGCFNQQMETLSWTRCQ